MKFKDHIECNFCDLTIYNKDCPRHVEYEGDGALSVLRDVKICNKCGRDIEIEYWKVSGN